MARDDEVFALYGHDPPPHPPLPKWRLGHWGLSIPLLNPRGIQRDTAGRANCIWVSIVEPLLVLGADVLYNINVVPPLQIDGEIPPTYAVGRSGPVSSVQYDERIQAGENPTLADNKAP